MSMGGGGSSMGGFFGGLMGDVSQYQASKKASHEMRKALRQAMAKVEEYYQKAREDLAPWRTTGTEAVNQLWGKIQAGPGEYEESPYYNFLLGEGTKALERGAAARGSQLSGAQQKGLIQYGQDWASTDYHTWLGDWFNSLVPYQSMAQMGLSAVNALTGGTLNTGSNIGNLLTDIGGVKAQQIINKGNLMASSMRSTGQFLGGIADSTMTGGMGGGMGGGGSGMSLGSFSSPSMNWQPTFNYLR